ncbi:MAG: hypothetical protein V5A88_03435 [Candidatus Thermoplasmatota archaeon]
MKIRENDYEEMLQKEERRRKIKIFRHLGGIGLMAVVVIFLYLRIEGAVQIALIVGAILYILYVLRALYKDASALFSLTDELHFEDGEIIKYNPEMRKTKKWIPLESVEKVYFNITEKPNLIFVVYTKDDWKRGESFYKQRIPEREKFIEAVKEKGLFENDPISFQELKEEVEE